MEGLLPWYERALSHLRQRARGFAARYPKIAQHLVPADERESDPHVKQMLDALALLAARIDKKLDDDYPQFADSAARRSLPALFAAVSVVLNCAVHAGRGAP
jgi:type VI secretion system protein ImpG